MKLQEQRDNKARARRIIGQLNILLASLDAPCYTHIDEVIQDREESGLPEMTESELSAAEIECAENARRVDETIREIAILEDKYRDLMGVYPRKGSLNKYEYEEIDE